MAETPDLKKVIDDMYLGNADISRLPNIFPEQYAAFNFASGVVQGEALDREGVQRQIKTGWGEISQGDILDIGGFNLSAADGLKIKNRADPRTAGKTPLKARGGFIDGKKVANNLEINWRRFTPIMAEGGLTADRVFDALYHADQHLFSGGAKEILEYPDRPAMEAVMKVFEYIDPLNSDQIYDPAAAELEYTGLTLIDHPRQNLRTPNPNKYPLPIGATLTAEYHGKDYHPEELKAAKKYWWTPVTDEDLSQWANAAADTVSVGGEIDKSQMPFSDFARKANQISDVRSLTGQAKINLPFVKAKNIPAVIKASKAGWQDIRPGMGVFNLRSLVDLSTEPSGGLGSHTAASNFLSSVSPAVQDLLVKSPSAMAAVEGGLSPLLDKVYKAIDTTQGSPEIEDFISGIYGQALTYYFENSGKNEQALVLGIANLNDIVSSWGEAKQAIPSDNKVAETYESSGDFLGKKLTMRLATAEENKVGCHAINLRYFPPGAPDRFCVADGVYEGEMREGKAFGYLISEEGTEGDVGFAISRGNGFFDWGHKNVNRGGVETPFVKEIKQAFPSSGDANTPLSARRQIQSFFEIFRKFFGTTDAGEIQKVIGHVNKLLEDKKLNPATGMMETALDRGKPLKFFNKPAAKLSQEKLKKVSEEIAPKFKITAESLKKFRKLKTLGIGIGIGAAAAAFPSVASAATGAAGGGGGLASTLITGAAIIGGIGVAAGLGVAAYKGAKAAKIPSVLGNIMSGPGGGTINRNTGSRIYNNRFIQGELDLTTRGFFAGIGSVINDFGLNRRIGGFDPSGKPSSFLDSFFGKALGTSGYVHPVYRADEAFWQVANNLDDAYQGWKNYITTSHSRSSGLAKFFHGARYHGFKLLDSVGDGWLNKQLVKAGGLSTMIAPALMGYGAIGDFKSGYRQSGVLGGIGNTALGIATGLVQNKVIAGALLNPTIGLTGGAVAAAAGYTAFKIFDVRNKGADYIRSGRMGGISWNRGPTPGMSSSIGASVRQRAINAMENSRFNAMKAIGNESYMMSAPKARYSGSTAIYGTSSMLSY
jgi:hypothetical protein